MGETHLASEDLRDPLTRLLGWVALAFLVFTWIEKVSINLWTPQKLLKLCNELPTTLIASAWDPFREIWQDNVDKCFNDDESHDIFSDQISYYTAMMFKDMPAMVGFVGSSFGTSENDKIDYSP